MKKTFVIGAGVALGLALVATVALAFGPGFGLGFGRGFGPAFGGPPISNLTAEQSAQIQALRDGFLKEIEPLRKELYAKQTELQSLWSVQNPDQAAVSAKQKEMFNLQSQLQEKSTTLGLEMRKVFTPEQLAQMPALSQGAGFGPGSGFGPGGRGPMGMRGPMGRW